MSLEEAEYAVESMIHLAKDIGANTDDINELENLRPILDACEGRETAIYNAQA